jgi:hypothetical protein
MKKRTGLLIATAFGLSGCFFNYQSSKMDSGDASDIITFPRPMGDWIIPLEVLPTYRFQFTELDGESKVKATHNPLTLYIRAKGENLYGFSYENPDSGLLMIQKPGRDSAAGIYIVGKFIKDSILLRDTILWLQQFPRKDIVRQLGPDWTMTCVDTGAAYYSKVDVKGENIAQAGEHPMYRYSTLLFREKLREREFYYYLHKGVGILGMEEVVDGKTMAIGTLDYATLEKRLIW